MLSREKNPSDLSESQRHEMERLIPTREDTDSIECAARGQTSPIIFADENQAVMDGEFIRRHLEKCHHRADLAEYW